MQNLLPFLFAAVVGFSHAFEADHLVAVGNIVTRRDSLRDSIKDGIFWGLGHTSTIFLIGALMIIAKVYIDESIFRYFEAGVGLMLIGLGIYRLYQYFIQQKRQADMRESARGHRLAYGIGLVHGLAGSGTLVLLVMADIEGSLASMLYLLIFGIGSVVGMLLVAGIFHLPFSKQIRAHAYLQPILVVIAAILCVGYGGYLFWESLF